MRAKLMIIVTVATGGSFWPLSALADKPAPTSAPSVPTGSKDIARDLLAHASAAFHEGSFKEACDFYRAARMHRPTREITCNLGVAARLAGNLIEAAQELTRCLAEPPPAPVADEEKKRIARYHGDLDVVRGQIGTLAVQAPAGADVLIDNEAIGRAPLAVEPFVLPGSHEVVVRHNGNEASTPIFVGPGKRAFVTLTPIAASKTLSALKVSTDKKMATRTRSTPVVVGGLVATGLILGAGLAAFGASRAVGDGVANDLDESYKANTVGCAMPTPSANCQTASSSWRSAATLTKLATAGVITGSIVGGGTVIYIASTSPASGTSGTPKFTGFMIGWRCAW